MTPLTMNHLTLIQCLILALTLSLVMVQLLVRKKQTMHILFAIFCGSVAIATSRELAGDSLGVWQYVIGMGACATCNIYWLLSRTLFRHSQALNIHHVSFAILLGVLMMAQQGYLFVDSIWPISTMVQSTMAGVLREAITMFSSVVLIMSVWEGLRGFRSVKREQKAQRLTYLVMLGSAICVAKFISVSYATQPDVAKMMVACVTLVVIAFTQLLIMWITATAAKHADEGQSSVSSALLFDDGFAGHSATRLNQTANNNSERELAAQIRGFLDQHYLQTNLKVADVARALNVSEYRVSRVLKHYFQAKNFNHYVNQIRIAHARALLADPASRGWPVLVVGLESGFASVGPFTRAFKQFTGVTPAQYRQRKLP